MTIGTSNRTAIRRVKEVDFGVIPPTPALIDTRYTGEGINFQVSTTTSNEIRSDRMTSDLVRVGADTVGNLDIELSYGSYDDLIEAALFSPAPVVVNIPAAITISVDQASSEIRDSAGGFIIAGIVVGQWIKTSGFVNAGNNGFFLVSSVAAGVLVVVPSSALPLVDEAEGPAVTITGDMIRNGVVDQSFVFQKNIEDIDIPTFLNYYGCKIGQMSLEFATGSILTGAFDVQGLGADDPSDSQIPGATVVPPSTTTPMNAVDNVVNVLDNGIQSTQHFNTISLTINNNLRPVDAVGSLPHIDVKAGRLEVTGSVGIYYEDKSAYERFINGTAFSLSFVVVDDAGSAYIFTFPRVKLSTGTLNSGGLDTDMVFETEFTAIVDPNTNCMVQVDRFTAV